MELKDGKSTALHEVAWEFVVLFCSERVKWCILRCAPSKKWNSDISWSDYSQFRLLLQKALEHGSSETDFERLTFCVCF